MKIALIADPHLSDVENTPQEAVLSWALSELEALRPDACVWLGDITACGSPEAAMRFRKKTDALPFPSVTVVGNSDIRTPDTAPVLERFLSNYPCGLLVGDTRIVGVNTSHNCILPSERARLSRLAVNEDVLLCTHQSPKHIDADSVSFLSGWMTELKKNGHRVLAWAHGHVHVFWQKEFEGVPTISVRALDIDKNCGGNAHICLLDLDGSAALNVEQILYRRHDLESFDEEERREIADFLGVTCDNQTKVERDMPFAIERGIRHLEWRDIREGELPLLERWRRAGGQNFSLHFPELSLDERGLVGWQAFKAHSASARTAGADMVTVHPPYLSNVIMLKGNAFEQLADAMADALLPVAQAGIDILVENSHTQRGATDDTLKRQYGCTPAEVIGWRDALNERLGKGRCHLRLDVGHARNNEPLSQNYTLGKWYALTGADTRAYHLHQIGVDPRDYRMLNHHPIQGLHNGMISFDGFLWAWRCRLLTHGPLILEVREGDGACATWDRLHRILQA